MDILQILKQMDIKLPDDTGISQFRSEEDGSPYCVWKVQTEEDTYVLKKAQGQEISIYTAFFRENIRGVPRFIGSTVSDGEEYFLMEYVSGEDLRVCTRAKLIAALDVLIALQRSYWENRELAHMGVSVDIGLKKWKDRKEYLKDSELEKVYEVCQEQYTLLPRTLCHDDLLPFNILAAEGRAAIIDWEYAGILPYPTSLARLIAHGEEQDDAFFYMTEDDKDFAVDYYYENLVKEKGISYSDYRKALDGFLLYEYCEWIMLGNKYPDADIERYRIYMEKAKAHISKMKK